MSIRGDGLSRRIRAAGVSDWVTAVVAALRERLEHARTCTAGPSRPRVLCLEWRDREATKPDLQTRPRVSLEHRPAEALGRGALQAAGPSRGDTWCDTIH